MAKSHIQYPEGPGGREVCLKNGLGRREYYMRKRLMWERQHGLCAICCKPLRLEESTFDHENGRGLGGGRRDDRIEIDGKPNNAAVHWLCNSAKGSSRTPYVMQTWRGAA